MSEAKSCPDCQIEKTTRPTNCMSMDYDPECAIVFCPLHAAAPRMLALLKKLEFSQDDGMETNGYCPDCGQFHHENDCELGLLLEELK